MLGFMGTRVYLYIRNPHMGDNRVNLESQVESQRTFGDLFRNPQNIIILYELHHTK